MGSGESGAALPEGVVRSALSGLVQAAARDTRATRGTIPAGLERAVAAASPRRTRTDWRRMLHLFGTSGTTTYLKPTIMSPSRRFGTVPGVRVRQRQALAVAVDTSGSIDDGLLAAFFSEVHALWRLGVDVTVIECDAEIAEGGVWQYRGRFARRTSGGGGTNFDAPITWANRNPVDGLVYLTDGFGGRSVPCRRRLLWMVTEEHSVRDSSGFARPGEAVCHLDVAAVHAR
jgi:predicted metal-dependent peptidase